MDDWKYSPGKIWVDITAEAIEKEADCVIIAGDVIDRKSMYYGAFGDFEEGIRRLSRNNIPTYVTSGNHDFDVLPELVDNLEGYDIYQLGKGGKWESVALPESDSPLLNIAGWSYPSKHYPKNPFGSYELEFDNDLPTIGLLHSEINSPQSNFAPVSPSDLERSGVDLWVLGHEHGPRGPEKNEASYLVPGVPQPLDPTEAGPHGPWLVTFEHGKEPNTAHSPLANLRYETLSIDAEDFHDPAEIPGLFYRKAEEVLTEEDSSKVELLVADLMLKGRTDAYDDLTRKMNELREGLSRRTGTTRIELNRIENRAKPKIDLEKLSREHNPAGLLAELLMNIERGNPDELPQELIGETKKALNRAYTANAYHDLRTQGEISKPGATDTINYITEAGWLILESLVSQKTGDKGE